MGNLSPALLLASQVLTPCVQSVSPRILTSTMITFCAARQTVSLYSTVLALAYILPLQDFRQPRPFSEGALSYPWPSAHGIVCYRTRGLKEDNLIVFDSFQPPDRLCTHKSTVLGSCRSYKILSYTRITIGYNQPNSCVQWVHNISVNRCAIRKLCIHVVST